MKQSTVKTNNQESPLKAIIFDYDGVLINSRDIGLKAYQAIAQHFGVTGYTSLKEFQSDQKRKYKNILHEWGATTPELVKHAETIYRAVHEEHHKNLSEIPGMRKVLDTLSKKYTIALVSGTYSAIIESGLKNNNMLHYFKHIIGADDVKNVKPEPDGLLLSLQKLGIQPHEAMYVGDMVIDIQMGRAAKVKTAILTSHSWNALDDLKAQNPDLLIEHPDHLLQHLGELT